MKRIRSKQLPHSPQRYRKPLIDKDTHIRIKSIAAGFGVTLIEFYRRIGKIDPEELKKLIIDPYDKTS